MQILDHEQTVPPGPKVFFVVTPENVLLIEAQKGEILECLLDPASDRILVSTIFDFDDQILVVAVVGDYLEDDRVRPPSVVLILLPEVVASDLFCGELYLVGSELAVFVVTSAIQYFLVPLFI